MVREGSLVREGVGGAVCPRLGKQGLPPCSFGIGIRGGGTVGSPSPHEWAQRESGFDLRGEEMLSSKMESFEKMGVRLGLRSLRPPLPTVNLRRSP